MFSIILNNIDVLTVHFFDYHNEFQTREKNDVLICITFSNPSIFQQCVNLLIKCCNYYFENFNAGADFEDNVY